MNDIICSSPLVLTQKHVIGRHHVEVIRAPALDSDWVSAPGLLQIVGTLSLLSILCAPSSVKIEIILPPLELLRGTNEIITAQQMITIIIINTYYSLVSPNLRFFFIHHFIEDYFIRVLAKANLKQMLAF